MSYPAFPKLARMDRWVNTADATDVLIETQMRLFTAFVLELERKYGRVGAYGQH